MLSERLFRRVGGSTGTKFIGVLYMASVLMREKWQGALVTLICDSGDRYSGTYFNDVRLADQNICIKDWRDRIETYLDYGRGEMF